jgi:hypothetical protein
LPGEKLWNLSEDSIAVFFNPPLFEFGFLTNKGTDELLEGGIQILTQWENVCKFLTGHHWAVSHSSWKDVDVLFTVNIITKRLNQVFSQFEKVGINLLRFDKFETFIVEFFNV